MKAQERVLEFGFCFILHINKALVFSSLIIFNKLLMHAVGNYLMACISVTARWHEPCGGHCMTGVC